LGIGIIPFGQVTPIQPICDCKCVHIAIKFQFSI
jgi:hypothetical protein